MKKQIVIAFAVMALGASLLTGCNSKSTLENSSANQTEESADTEMANPWTETDKDGIAKATGFDMTAPKGASDITYSYMSKEGMAQMSYELDGSKWTYRMQMVDELTDISGITVKWTKKSEGKVSAKEAVYYEYDAQDDSSDKSVQLVNWYDAVAGVTYSLSVTGDDLNGLDLQAYAEDLYVPLQSETDGDADGDTQTQSSQSSQTTKKSQSSQTSQITGNTQNSQSSQTTKKSQNSQTSQITGNTQDSQSSQTSEKTQDSQKAQSTESSDTFSGEYTRAYDGSTLTITEKKDGTYSIDINITKLCSMENGTGTFSDGKMSFVIQDPSENDLSGVISKNSDGSLSMKITDSTWGYIENGEVFDDFTK